MRAITAANKRIVVNWAEDISGEIAEYLSRPKLAGAGSNFMTPIIIMDSVKLCSDYGGDIDAKNY